MCSFYDYIRSLKPSAIRYLKNISLVITFVCIAATIVVLASPATETVKATQPVNNGGGGCSDKKLQMEQAKKDYILRRFISYYKPATSSLK
jgi:hypothetical protein